MPDEKLSLEAPLYIGLTAASDRLMHLRRTRLHAKDEQIPAHAMENEYLDEDKITEEIRSARRLFSRKEWPVIDVTKRSIEETAAEIMALLQSRKDKIAKKEKEESGE